MHQPIARMQRRGIPDGYRGVPRTHWHRVLLRARSLQLAAAPIFAGMAIWTAISNAGMPGLLCSAPNPSPLDGMTLMYVLMAAFHGAPWLKFLSDRRHG